MKKSAGILVYRRMNTALEVLLVHPGGPFWRNKDAGAWTIPKGEFNEPENALDAAKRECKEEVGLELTGPFLALTPLKQKAGKLIYAWAAENDFDTENMVSNTFQLEWPPKSGQLKTFPEVDQARWFVSDEAKRRVNPAQAGFIDELILKLQNFRYL